VVSGRAAGRLLVDEAAEALDEVAQVLPRGGVPAHAADVATHLLHVVAAQVEFESNVSKRFTTFWFHALETGAVSTRV